LLRLEGATLFGAPGEALDPRRHEVADVVDTPDHAGRVARVVVMGVERESIVLQKAIVVATRSV
jgi:molecular chaperone GrpE (heat shock protein)